MAVLGVALIGLLQTVPARAVAEPPLPSASTTAATQITIAGYGNGQPLSGFVANPFTPWDSATTPYPGAVPTGFVTRNVGFAGLFLANPVSGGTTQLQLYCIDINTATGPPLGYVLGTWSEANINNVGLVARTLTQYFPYNPAAPAGLTPDQQAAAVQAAIWYFSDNFVLPPTDPLHSVVASIVQTVQALGPLTAPPTPTVNITPSQISVAQGRLAGPYTVNVGGPATTATVEAFGATMFADAAGTIPIQQGSHVNNGQQIWLQSTGGSTASLQATADAIVPETNVYLYDGATAGVPEAQKLILALPAQVTATVSAEATFLPPGSLTVNKVIQGPSAGQQGAITISVVCDDVELGPITIPANTPAGTVPTVFNEIPANSLCTVRETGTGADVNLAVTVTGSGSQVTIPSGGSQTVTITNTYTPPTGSLIVSKTIAGNGAGLQGPVTISVTCTPPNGTPTTLPPITINGGTGAQTINRELSGLAPGSVCTATETSDGSNSVVHVTVTCGQPPIPCATNGDGQPIITVTIPQTGEGLASFTDTYGRNPGSLLITKHIVGGGQQGPIQILVDCPGAEAQGFPMTFTINAGATGTHTFGPFTGIPAGTVCTITEPETGENDAVSVTVDGLGQVTIPAGGQGSSTITDTYTPAVGSLVVNKSITGPGAGLQDQITIHVACTPNGPTQDFTIPARTGGGTLPPFTLNNIPAGSSCTVSEPANGSNTAVTGTVTIGPPATVTVPARGQGSVQVVDNYTLNPGFIRVAKNITGTSAGSHGPIRIVVDCPESGQQFTFDIPAAVTGPQTSDAFGPIPAGTVCTVTETLNGTEGISGLQVTITGNNQQVTVQPGVTSTASLGDDYHPNPGFLTVNKYVSGPGAGLQDAAVITVTCTPANSSTVVFQDTFTIPAGAPNGFTDSKVFGPIPAFSVCSVAESPNGSNSAVTAQVVISQESGIIISPAPSSAPTRAVAGEIDVFDNYTINNGSLVVNKNITGTAAGQQGPITITVDCPGLPTQTFTIPGGATGPQGPFTVPNIPIDSANGTTCAVTETANGTENNNTINVAVTGTGDVTVPPGGQGTANITDTYTPILGGLTVKKTIAGNGVGAQGPVVITVSCTGVPPTLTPDFVIGPGATTDQSMNYPDIPAGSTCTVIEVVNGGNTAVSVVTVPTTGTPQSVTIPPSDTAVVNISDTYTLNQGSLVVNKNITGAAAGQQGPITITVDCPGLPTQTFNINGGATGPQGPFTVSNIPIDSANGTTCTVSETRNGSTDASGAAIPTIQVTVTGEGPVTVAPGGTPSTANLTNTVEPTPGSLVVTKTINGPAAGHQGPITINVDCAGVSGFPTSFTVPANATSFPPQVFNDIPAGSSCTVSESATVNGSTTTVRLASVTINPGQPVTVGANQTVPVDVSDIYEFNPGQIIVQKNITGAAAGQQDPIRIEVDCPGLPTPSFVYTIPAGATGLQPAQTFGPVPVGTADGSTCTVSETVNGETNTVNVAVSPVTQDVTVPAGGTGTAQTITNDVTFKAGGLSVVKDIAGEGAGHQGPITISVDCPGVTGFPTSFTIPAGTGAGPYTPQQFDNIPAGTVCTVTETGFGNNTEVTVTPNPATQTVPIPAGAVAEVNVGNTVEFNPGLLVVSKAMEGPVAGQQGPVSILAECGDQTFTFDIPANATGTQTSPPFGPIPAGTVCTVTETANGETSTVEVTITGDGETEAIPPGGTATANLTDTFTPTPGELVVTKNIDGATAGQQGVVTINVTCTLNGQTVLTTDITIPAGSKAGAYQNTVSDIPAGSSCRVLETNDGKTSIITVNVVGADQTVTVGAAETAMVSILDSYDLPTGGIKVEKTIAGSGAGQQGEVAILVSCQQPNNVYVFRVRAGAPAGTYQQIFNYIPSGLNCTVTETEDGSNSSVTAQVSGSPQRVAVPASSIATAGTITDTYESPPPTPSTPGVPGQPSIPGLPSTGYGGD